MKKILLLTSLIFLLIHSGKTQTSNLIKKDFITGTDVTVQLYDYLNKKTLPDSEANKLIFPSNWKFRVVGITDSNTIIVKQWASRKNPNSNDKDTKYSPKYIRKTKTKTYLKQLPDTTVAYTSDKNDNQFFTIPLSEFDTKCDPYFVKGIDFTFGVMTIPIKLRARSKKSGTLFEFEEKFNIGISAGIKFSFNSRKDRSLSFLANTSVSTVGVDSLNTKGFQKESTSSGAFTIATGLVFKQDDFNIGLFLGWDKVPGVLGRNWTHYGKPWIGVGIGFSLFTISLKGTESGKQ
ncbi:MAG: hypothetical protein ABL876_03045 [Chitinophagaceae bacterium]